MQDFLSDIVATEWLRAVGGVFALTLLALVTNRVARRAFLVLVQRVGSRTQSTWDDRIIERQVFQKLANVAPALVMYAGIGWALGAGPEALSGVPAPDAQTGWDAFALAG